MQKIFVQTINDMRGLINKWSASSANSSDEPAKILLAVSGGVDSMSMASLFAENFPHDSFAVAHCNFNLRGKESDADEALVRKWTSENKVAFHVVSFDTKPFAAENGVSIEMAARELRYRWFSRLCVENGYPAVAVAHNANDNAETLMLNLLRGSGINGLSGMSQVSDLPYAVSEGQKLVRPLLGFTRKQIEGYAFANRIGYREDHTNSESEYKRNRIRNEVFPVFEKINPSAVRTINREMGYYAEAAGIVEDYCRALVPSLMKKEEDGRVCILLDRLMDQKYWKYLLYHMLEPYGFSSPVLASVEDLLSSDRTLSGKSFRSDTHVLLTERDRLIVMSGEIRPYSPELVHESFIPVRGAGKYCVNGVRFTVEIIDRTPDMVLKQPEGTVILDADKVSMPFVCRTWRNGDWMVPYGMKGKKKISDLFADLKYGHKEKSEAVMIVDCSGEYAEKQRVAGVLGVRIDDRCKVGKDTVRIIRLSIKE